MNEKKKKYEVANEEFNLIEHISMRFGLTGEASSDGYGMKRNAITCPICGGKDFYVYDAEYNYNGFQTWSCDCLETYLEKHQDIKEKTKIAPKKPYFSPIEFFMVTENINFQTATNKVMGMLNDEKAREIAKDGGNYLYYSDRGTLCVNSSLLAEHIRKTSDYFIVKKQGSETEFVYWYQDGCYRHISSGELKSKIKEFIPLDIRRPKQWEDTYKDILTDNVFVRFEDLNNESNLINFRNGLYDIQKDELMEHSPDYKITFQCDCNYNPDAPEPKTLLKYLETLTEGDADLKATLQEWFGLIISNYNANMCKKSVALFGSGDTGKSKYISMMAELIGIDNICSTPIQDLSSRFGAGNLYGTKAVIIDDQKGENIEDGSTYKAITGMGIIQAELKGKQAFTFLYKGGITFTCNAMPYIKDDKGSHMFERMLIVPCDNVIPDEEKDPLLMDKLISEKEGIVLWALEGLKRLISNKFKLTISERSRVAMKEYRAMNDSFYKFLTECYDLTRDKAHRIKKTELEDTYHTWATMNGIEEIKKKNIKERAKLSGINLVKVEGNYFYNGIVEKLPF